MMLAALAPFAPAQTVHQEEVPTKQVEVYAHHTKDVTFEGATSAVVLDEDVCRIQIDGDRVHILANQLGESAVLVWAGEKRLNLLVRVTEEPVVIPPPTLQQFTTFGSGTMRSYAAVNRAGGNTTLAMVNQFDWTQSAGPSRQLHVTGMFTDQTSAGGHAFDLGSATIAYLAPRSETSVGDFGLFLNGSPTNGGVTYLPVQGLTVRGFDLRLKGEQNTVEWFAGTAIPSYFINYSRTPKTAGFSWTRTVNARLRFFSTTFYSRTFDAFNLNDRTAQSDTTSIAGFKWQASNTVHFEANGGAGRHGRTSAASIAYQRRDLQLFSTVSYLSPNGTFSNLRVSSATGTNMGAGGTYRVTPRLQVSAGVQHLMARTTETVSGSIYQSGSSSASLGTNYDFRNHSLATSYNFTGATQVGTQSNGNIQHFETALRSYFGASVTNTARYAMYHYGESKIGYDQRTDMSVEDSARWLWKPGLALVGGFSYGRTGSALIDRIRQQLWMLTADQQALFEQNPAAFLSSGQLPPALQAALDSLQTSHTVINGGVEFSRNNFQVTPNVRIGIHDASSNTNSYQFGYTASYMWKDLLLQSSLMHQYYVLPSSASVQGTTQFTIGVVKRMDSNPMQWLSQKVQRGRIRGRVFVDEKIRGAYEKYDRGLRGIRVVLDDGKVVTTDANGEFQFNGLDARVYTVSIPLDQFPTAVRMTTPSPIRVDLTKRRTADVPFGVINFARVVGMAYNDYTMLGVRPPDAPGIGGLKLTMLEPPDRARMSECDSGGEYEFSNLQPGKYSVEVDPASLPANYELLSRRFEVELQPASTFVLDVPVRAIRTISGVVMYQENASAPARPLADMIVEAGGQSAKTGADGSFLLRHLPAGEITIRVLPPVGTELPGSVRLPAGKIRLTREPQQVEGVKITITNPVLINYLLRDEKVAKK